MYIVVFTSFLAIFLTYLESKKILGGGMKVGFIFLAFLGCIHYDYGNDYMAYLNMYKDITKYPFDLEAILSGDTFKEPGWVILCYVFKNLGGFFMMVAVLNIVQNILIYKNIKRYVEKKWWPMSVFIYTCFTSLYLMSFSMMRQFLVMVIFFAIWPLIEKKKVVLVAFVLLLCSTIHTSALVLLPFAFLGYIPIYRSKWWALAFICFYLAIWFGGTLINDVFSAFMAVEQFSDYADYYGDLNQKVTFGAGFLINQIPFIIALFYLLNDSEKKSQSDKALVCLSMISFVIVPFASIIPLVGRIGMYFTTYQIIAIPMVYADLNKALIRYVTMFIFIFMTLYDYIIFFNSPIFFEKYATFKTILPEIF